MRKWPLIAAACGLGAWGSATAQQTTPGEDDLKRLASCEGGAFTTHEVAGAVARYDVVGAEADRCRLRFTYLENPNPRLEGKPLTFLIDPSSADLTAEVQQQLGACLDGTGRGCQGELFRELGGGTGRATARVVSEGALAGVPEFRHGLLRLLVAEDGKRCGEGAYGLGLPHYDDAHYVYLDPRGEIVLRQQE